MTRRPALSILFQVSFLLLFLVGTGIPAAHADEPGAGASAWERSHALTKAALKASEDGHHRQATEKLEAALALRPNHPVLIYGLAQTTAASGETQAALDWLERYAALGATTDLARADALMSLHNDPRFPPLAQKIKSSGDQRGAANTAFTASKTLLLVEGIAFDKTRGRYFLSSIYERKIVVAASDGTITPFANKDDGLWSPTGMKVDDKRRQLVVASAATPQTAGIVEADRGKSAVHSFDLETGRVTKKWQFHGNQSWFGEIETGADGTLYISDSLQNALFVIRPGSDEIEPLVSYENWPSPQGITLSADGSFLFLADYAMGLFRIDLASNAVTALAPSADLAPYGIDGLYTHGHSLIAVQNGMNPQRVIRINLNEAGDKILDTEVLVASHPDFLEPTLGVITGDTFRFVANSGWPHFNKPPEDPEALRKNLPPTVVLKIDLAR